MSVERKFCFSQPERALEIFKHHIVSLPARTHNCSLPSLFLSSNLFPPTTSCPTLRSNPSGLWPGSTALGAARPWITRGESLELVFVATASARCALMQSIFMPRRPLSISILRAPTTGAVRPPATNPLSLWGHRRVRH